MPEFLLVLVSTILVNNFVLVQFLGLCPFMGVSNMPLHHPTSNESPLNCHLDETSYSVPPEWNST